MGPVRVPHLEVTVSLCDADGAVVERIRLCWEQQPSAAAALQTLMRISAQARTCGQLLRIDQAPDEVTVLLGHLGLCAPAGPIDVAVRR